MPFIKKISSIFKLYSFFILFSISLSGTAVHSADVILTWDRPNDSQTAGYKVFYGLAETDFKSIPKETIDSPDQTSCDIFNLEDGEKYGFAAKSFDYNDNENVFSEVIFYKVPKAHDMHSSDDADSNKNTDNIIDNKNNGDSGNSNDDDSDDDLIDNNNNGAGSSGGGCFISQVSDLSTNN